jgi:hypothetical protein
MEAQNTQCQNGSVTHDEEHHHHYHRRGPCESGTQLLSLLKQTLSLDDVAEGPLPNGGLDELCADGIVIAR